MLLLLCVLPLLSLFCLFFALLVRRAPNGLLAHFFRIFVWCSCASIVQSQNGIDWEDTGSGPLMYVKILFFLVEEQEPQQFLGFSAQLT